MRFALGLTALLALTSCQPGENSDRSRLDDLSTRVTTLEQRQLKLQRQLEAMESEPRQSSPEAITMWQLQGASGGAHRYGTKERCEAALQAFAADQVASDAAKGVNVVRESTLSCDPV